ncbi:MAG: FAD-binding protein [Acidobacteriota bacterium]|nr:FAD-binding protein [Acidobacteriota bacterium]
MKPRGYLTVALATTLNIILYAATFGHFIWLEGRVRGGVFRNWIRRFRYRPRRVVYPTTEGEIVSLIKSSTGIRFFGAGHSFNDGVVADDTLVSLDKYSGVIRKNLKDKQVTFKGGTRVREVVRLLLADGLAFRALPSHDAQSIAGILSTDVHGTGTDWGFVSELVVSLKVVDGRGDVHVCYPADDLFKAAIGGIGAVGVITEVTVQAVDRFNVEQRVRMSDLTFVEANLDRLLLEHRHLSLYLFPFTTRCQINTWDPTGKPRSFLGDFREFVTISVDALLAAWFGGLMAAAGLLPRLSHFAHGIKRGTNLVLESNRAFNRTIYHMHQELEFTVPFGQTFEVCRRYLRLYEEMYPTGMPYTIIEVRFTPAGHDRTLVGAGRERRSAWLDILCNDTAGFERYFAASERLMKEIGARPHPGKFCESFRKDDLARLHQAHFDRFLRLIEKHDPEGKLANEFTRRLFRGL